MTVGSAMRLAARSGLIVAALLLGGCSDWARGVAETARRVAHPSPELPTREEVLARPYFQMRVDQGRHSAVLVLGNVDGDREAWYSGDGVIVFLRHGLLVKSSGMGWGDLVGTSLPAGSPFLAGLQRLEAPVVGARVVDLSPGYRYGVRVESRLSPGPMESVQILGEAHELRRIDEHVSAAGLDWQADNRYWVDPADGLVWKTRQTLPDGPTLTLTMLRPYQPEAETP
ncbi:YjbF family lipoprotein [Frateuria hangzhouensis]|uniref:YjbF family lipoprotein n=1 Tax=Frateuria hangzhouensis TaxID=2995589 RepID=UPI002260EF67|nr:YjbF family lipoprotein [Frateuria sp. STR12]MCX7515278.1 YjbF family lipoprotein [Frateuria sp. STR12]